MDYPVGAPTFELRAVALAKTDPGDAVLDGKPLIDEFGQYTHADWPGKAHSLADLKQAWTAESEALKTALPDRCEYGGFASTHAKATGFFRVEFVRSGAASGSAGGTESRSATGSGSASAFFSTGINGVGTSSGTRVQGREDLFAAQPPRDPTAAGRGGRGGGFGGGFYTWNLQRRLGEDGWRTKWAEFTARRMMAWGFNSIHYWGPRNLDASAEPRVPYAQMLRGWQTGQSIMGLPDVYAEDFVRQVDETAASQLGPRKSDPWMLGYFIGNEPAWPGRENQLADLLLAGPDGAMKQKLTTHLAGGDTPERRRAFVHAAFARYLEVIDGACRKHAPNHLNLGIRFGGSAHDDLVKLMRGCDVFSLNIYRYAPARANLDRLYALTQRPILIGEFHIGVPERGLSAGLVQAMNQEERGVAYRYYVEQAASHPAMVGTHWFQWLDQPVTGRNDGENYNIGFVDSTDRPYPELVEAAKTTHQRLHDVHAAKILPFAQKPKASAAGAPSSPRDP
jgi:hypothetical protein